MVFDFMQSIFSIMIDLKREIITTKDGSHSLFVPALNEQYHSIHGAKQEAEHVFLKMGLGFHRKEKLRVFEVGFGTGLNAFLSQNYVEVKKIFCNYHSIEKFPINKEQFKTQRYSNKTRFRCILYI